MIYPTSMTPESGAPSTLQDRVTGTLWGLAAGDKIGGPIRMAMYLAECVLERNAPNVHGIGERYLEWWRDGAFDTGPVVARVLELVDGGLTFKQAAREVDQALNGMTAGCNPAHRCAPMAMCRWVSDDNVAPAAIVQARLTHAHPLAGDAAAALARLCRALIRGMPWHDSLTFAAAGRLPEVQAALATTDDASLSPGGFAPDALAAAVYFVGSSDTFEDALAQSIEFAGPANYCPVLVGSIGGARWGSGAFHMSLMVHDMEIMTHISWLGRSLAEGWTDLPYIETRH